MVMVAVYPFGKMPPLPQPDRFAHAAGRHLTDAQTLVAQNRLDNAMYLAGYVVECSLKALVSHHLGRAAAQQYGHDLAALQGRALQQLRVLVPQAHLRLPTSGTLGTGLDHGHPVRRYWASGLWTLQEVQVALNRAADIYRGTVLSMVLNGELSSQELNV